MEGMAEVYTAMIMAPTGRLDVATIGQGKSSWTIPGPRAPISKFEDSLRDIRYCVDTNIAQESKLRRHQFSRYLGLLQELCDKSWLRGIHVHRYPKCRRQQWCRQVLVSLCERTDQDHHSNRYKDQQGSLFYNGGNQVNTQPVYAAAYMIQSSPSVICPYYNGTGSYKSSTGLAYNVVCGGAYDNGIDINSASATSETPKF
jgi:hypothetical protein